VTLVVPLLKWSEWAGSGSLGYWIVIVRMVACGVSAPWGSGLAGDSGDADFVVAEGLGYRWWWHLARDTGSARC
jgi:hypothetical protein